ncbi:hypothetical protein HK100_000962 [Physocladia obscura]|uniref:Uncharacterized protein n=1 Tax=Physocladia obscura TaxID=109957 RepID=A0AAD5XF78_9FUNG|nr:hypothetical protein HK100_000962 [Physocladia obscura]
MFIISRAVGNRAGVGVTGGLVPNGGGGVNGIGGPSAFLHTSVAARVRYPTLYVRVTRRQGARVAAKEERLAAKEAREAKGKDKSANADSGSRLVVRLRQRAALAKRLSLAASAHVAAGLKDKERLAGDRLRRLGLVAPPRPLLIAPFLASCDAHADPDARHIRRFVPHSLTQTLASLGATTTTTTAATSNTTTNATPSATNTATARSFKVTSVAGAKDTAKTAPDSALGIPSLFAKALSLSTTPSASSVNAKSLPTPSFVYGITPQDAKSILIDAPIHLAALAAESGPRVYDPPAPANNNNNNNNNSTQEQKVGPPATIAPDEMAELLRRQISLENASVKEINKFNRQQVIQIFGRKPFDTGSPEVQGG